MHLRAKPSCSLLSGRCRWRSERRAHVGLVTFLCYCRGGQICHTVLLLEWLTRNYAAGFVGEGQAMPDRRAVRSIRREASLAGRGTHDERIRAVDRISNWRPIW